MRIEIATIRDKGLRVTDSLRPGDDLLLDEAARFEEPLAYDVAFQRDGEKVVAAGTVKTRLALRCVRCLEDYEQKVDSSFNVVLFPAHQIQLTSTSLSSDDMEYIFYQDDQIDLDKLLVEQVNLNIPYNPICRTSCRGICPNCGVNLNRETCGCEEAGKGLGLLFHTIKR